jgi:hypothetical protein
VIPGANSRDKQMGEIELLLEQQPAIPSPQALQQFAQQQELLAAAAQKMGAPPPPPPDMVPIPIPTAGPDGKPQPKIVPVPRSLLKSTIPVNKYDFDQFEYQTIKDWLSEPDGIEARRTNPLGVLNVELHGDMHEAAMKAKAPAGPPMPPPKRGKPGAAQPGEAGAPPIPAIAAALSSQPGAMNAPLQ